MLTFSYLFMTWRQDVIVMRRRCHVWHWHWSLWHCWFLIGQRYSIRAADWLMTLATHTWASRHCPLRQARACWFCLSRLLSRGQQPVSQLVWGEWIKLFSRRHRNGIIFTVNWHYCIASFPSGMNSARRGGELWVRAVGLRAGWDQTGPGSALLSSARSLLATECGLVVATACKHHTPGLWLAQSVPDLGADTWPNVLSDCPRRGRFEAARLSPGRVGDDNLRVTPTSIHWNCLMIMMEWQQWSWAASQWALGMWVIRRTVPSCQAASH